MQKIVCTYTEQLVPVAVDICQHLVGTFAQVQQQQCCGSWIRCFFDLWIRDPGWVNKSGSGSGMNDLDHISESIGTFFWGLKYLNSLMRIWDPGWRQFGSGNRDGKKSDPG
jgi:hypothetical protein